jgi:predicted dehydrogenase
MNVATPHPRLRIGMIGCGAVAEALHLPAIAACRDAAATVLVDRNVQRTVSLAQRFGAARTADDYRGVVGEVDAAIVAVPHHLHAPIAIDLLRNGIHVLVEKPMALHSRDCDDMIAAARESGAVLAVGLVRRFQDPLRFVKALLDAGVLGDIANVDLREGKAFTWKVASDAAFRRDAGGVLADAGAHVLDLLAWWFGDVAIASYRDDAMGGVEADCEIRLQLPAGAEAYVELSRTRNMRNSCVIRGTRGTVEVGTKTDSAVRLSIAGAPLSLSGPVTRAGAAGVPGLVDLIQLELEDFIQAIRERRAPLVTGEDGRRSVALIEACYALRTPRLYPWEAAPQPATRPAVLAKVS